MKKDNSSKDKSMEIRRKPPSQQLKGGLRDRSLFSWVRILAVTALWWAFVLGFICACFFLMYTILYSGDESADEPYFVRNQNKYPDILPQPGLAISCGNKTCTVTINKMFRWKPEPYDESYPQQTLYKRMINMTERLEKLKLVATGDIMVVTCLGADKEDDELLDGMTQDKAGVPINLFPWTKDSEDEGRQLILDLSNAKFFLAGTNKSCTEYSVKLHCQAWAKNFKEEGVKEKQRGGGRLLRLGIKGGRLETCATTKK